MWAVRQFALGIIFAFGITKRSTAALSAAYLFFLIMMLGDVVISLKYAIMPMTITSILFALLAGWVLFKLNRLNKDAIE